MFLVMIHYKHPLETVEKFVDAHRAYLGTCYEKDYFVVSGPKIPRTGGVMISQLKDRKQLEAVIALDPFKLNDIADFEIIEFNPVKYHTKFIDFI